MRPVWRQIAGPVGPDQQIIKAVAIDVTCRRDGDAKIIPVLISVDDEISVGVQGDRRSEAVSAEDDVGISGIDASTFTFTFTSASAAFTLTLTFAFTLETLSPPRCADDQVVEVVVVEISDEGNIDVVKRVCPAQFETVLPVEIGDEDLGLRWLNDVEQNPGLNLERCAGRGIGVKVSTV